MIAGSDRLEPETPFGTSTPEPVTARQVVNEMVEAGLFDDVMARIDTNDLQLTGEGGFLPEIVKQVLERGLQTELTQRIDSQDGPVRGRRD